MAYVGPGAGLSAIGAFIALIAGVVVAIFGFLWYPIKRLIRKRKENRGGRLK
jgi:flagellar biogenesis protein FliO